jgi:[NiFe] hydrogenase diaphorase moiety large subunit
MQKTGFLLSDIDYKKVLDKALGMKPNEIAMEVRNSNIRGRGGAGFSTGTKWMLCGAATADKKYVVCNADEGEPGTFKDRELLTKQFKKLITGMLIAGYSIKSDEGIIYLRGEYKWMVPQMEKELEELRAEGLLGKNIMGKDFNFDVYIILGAGAYVCGEETALIESIEGQRGEPRNKPPYPVNQGIQNKPTLVNNVETYCAVAHIIEKGAEWFKSFGTKESSGTKLFSISGDVERPGVYEFEMGTPLRKMLEVAGAMDPKAVQVGGASGRTVNEDEFDMPVAFEALPPGGSIIVIGKNRKMIDVLENFMEFFEEESCGQCTYCREGNYHLLKAVRKLKSNQLTKKELQNMINLANLMKVGSKCGLGQTSPNPFLDIIEKFGDEVLTGLQN